MIPRFNLHTHTSLCDGNNTAEEMVLAAIELGCDGIGFSGHSTIKSALDWTMSESREQQYIETVSSLKEKYKDRIEILLGIEYDVLSDIDASPYDYVIGSVHHSVIGNIPIDLAAEDLKKNVDELFDDMELLEQHLTNVRGRKCTVSVPQRGEGLKLVNMCRENAYEKLAQKKGRQSAEIKSLEELKNLLGLSKTPEYIESYDISHTGGDDNVAGMIVFKNGKPLKRAYRTFNIKSFAGQDDYGSMREVLSRRFDEYFKHKDNRTTEGFGKLPDLILLDGGKGQVSVVKEVMQEKNLDIPLFGMVKDSKHKTRAITGDGGEIAINSMRSAFTLVSEIQEEVHRFSVGFHHKKHTKKGLELTLTKIDGIGEKKAKELLKAFKTIKNIKSASVDELQKVKGINRQLAEKIYDFYRED